MTISAIDNEQFDVQSGSERRRISGPVSPVSVDYLERYISQLSVEKDLLQRNAESCIAMLEFHIRKLALERESLMRDRRNSGRRSSSLCEGQADLGNVPMQCLSGFLCASDMWNLGSSCKELYAQTRCSEGQIVIRHLTTPSVFLTSCEAEALVDSLNLYLVETLFIDAKKVSGKALLAALSTRSGSMRSLRTVRISAAAETGEFLHNLEKFMFGLPANQITSIHFSGLRSVSLVSHLIAGQQESIERFKADYFVNGHESDMEQLPVMPRLRKLVFDVADVVHLPVSQITNLLSSIKDKSKVETIYLPHMQISGQSHEIIAFTELVKEFTNARQLVIRFRRLPLSVSEIVRLREAFETLPAVCISDHFIVMLDAWATWWPKQSSIWPSTDKITGLSVFREQIDFESLGTNANREWLRLSKEQKNRWSRKIAPNVVKLYLESTENVH